MLLSRNYIFPVMLVLSDVTLILFSLFSLVVSWSMSKQGEHQKTEEEQEGGKSTEPQIISTCHHSSPLKNDSVGGILKTLNLKV